MSRLELKIENLREKLNELMLNKESNEYNSILDLSIELDKLLLKYYVLTCDANKKESTD